MISSVVVCIKFTGGEPTNENDNVNKPTSNDDQWTLSLKKKTPEVSSNIKHDLKTSQIFDITFVCCYLKVILRRVYFLCHSIFALCRLSIHFFNSGCTKSKIISFLIHTLLLFYTTAVVPLKQSYWPWRTKIKLCTSYSLVNFWKSCLVKWIVRASTARVSAWTKGEIRWVS